MSAYPNSNDDWAFQLPPDEGHFPLSGTVSPSFQAHSSRTWPTSQAVIPSNTSYSEPYHFSLPASQYANNLYTTSQQTFSFPQHNSGLGPQYQQRIASPPIRQPMASLSNIPSQGYSYPTPKPKSCSALPTHTASLHAGAAQTSTSTPRKPLAKGDASHATSPGRQKSKENDKPSETRSRQKGAGSKSGVMSRRDGGDSDTEINKLDPGKREEAELKDVKPKKEGDSEPVVRLTNEDKVKAVQWITNDVRWKDFRVKQAIYWIELSQKVFFLRYTSEQLKNYWNTNAWAKYKAVRELDEHTGGGDGDADRYEADEGGESEPENPPEEGPKKRKKGRANAGNCKFSLDVLNKFRESEIYTLIDKAYSSRIFLSKTSLILSHRAHDDPSVVRERDFNSAAAISDTDSTPSDDSDDSPRDKKRRKAKSPTDLAAEDQKSERLFKAALETLKQKALSATAIAEAQLELARKRDQREEEDRQERIRLAKKQEAREDLESIQKMCESTNPKLRELGEKRLAEYYS
ncbi:hypothetical protein CVT26_003241 [Gymnopilus dilepis]|uniref:No apical meristem-associated C-terminal domain-containing protein n=1 Tax=Gymnopilus dilepis TaxID=231916 RepID=A0A409Y5A6_9AGAR|nr:hypothetical protein CVT26_003241 [Gymnopilus dilepis]